MKNNTTLQMRLSNKQKSELQEMADKSDKTKAEFIRDLLRDIYEIDNNNNNNR